MVLGPYNSGKSTFIRRLSHGSSISIDKSGTTVALDHGVTAVFGVNIFLFGTPGLERFEVLRRILSRGADAALMIIDSVNPASFEEAKEIYNHFREQMPDIPCLLLANKQDIEMSSSPEKVMEGMELSEKEVIGIIGTSTVTGEGLDKAVKLIFLSVFNRHKNILTVVKEHGQEEGGLKSLAIRLKEPEQKVRSMLQWLAWRQLVIADWEDNRFVLPKKVREILEILEFAQTTKMEKG